MYVVHTRTSSQLLCKGRKRSLETLIKGYLNESGVGAGIKASGVERSKLYVTTKVVGTINQDVAAALDASLSKLGLDYVDLYLVHVPFSAGSPEGLQKIWAQREFLPILPTTALTRMGLHNYMQPSSGEYRGC